MFDIIRDEHFCLRSLKNILILIGSSQKNLNSKQILPIKGHTYRISLGLFQFMITQILS
jgi:hypothetical protein